jgi:hypothetical protein
MIVDLERESAEDLARGWVPRVLLLEWLAQQHPSWSDDQIVRRATLAWPVWMEPEIYTQH